MALNRLVTASGSALPKESVRVKDGMSVTTVRKARIGSTFTYGPQMIFLPCKIVLVKEL